MRHPAVLAVLTILVGGSALIAFAAWYFREPIDRHLDDGNRHIDVLRSLGTNGRDELLAKARRWRDDPHAGEFRDLEFEQIQALNDLLDLHQLNEPEGRRRLGLDDGSTR